VALNTMQITDSVVNL